MAYASSTSDACTFSILRLRSKRIGSLLASGLPLSAPRNTISLALALTFARSRISTSGTPVHSAVLTAPKFHCSPFTRGLSTRRIASDAHSDCVPRDRDRFFLIRDSVVCSIVMNSPHDKSCGSWLLFLKQARKCPCWPKERPFVAQVRPISPTPSLRLTDQPWRVSQGRALNHGE